MERFKFIVAVYLLLIKDNQILLSRRLNTGFEDGNYGLVSGHLEGSESVFKGIIREAKEEANLDLKREDLELAHVLHRISSLDGSERIDFFLKCEKWDGEIKNMEEDKCDDLSWFDLDKLPENTIGYVRDVIENYKDGDFFTDLVKD